MHRKANFDRIARCYQFLEYLTFGSALQRCRTHFLPQLLDRRHALILGDGDGRFLARLYAANSLLQADAVDTSAAMLNLLCLRCESAAPGARHRLHTHHHSALEHSPSADTDLVVAHFFFDCLTQPELDELVQGVAQHIRPEALWLISDFRIPPGQGRLPAKALVRVLYFAFQLLTGLQTIRLPNHEAALRQVNLIPLAQHHSLLGLLTTELWHHSPTSSSQTPTPSQPHSNLAAL